MVDLPTRFIIQYKMHTKGAVGGECYVHAVLCTCCGPIIPVNCLLHTTESMTSQTSVVLLNNKVAREQIKCLELRTLRIFT